MSESKTISRETLLDSMKKIKANDVKGELYFLIKNEKGEQVSEMQFEWTIKVRA